MRAPRALFATSLSRFAVLLAIALAGCAADDDDGGGLHDGTPTCMPPAQLTYNCSPLPLGAPNSCAGGPAFETMPAPDQDKAFPLGCEAAFPFCVGAFPNEVQKCFCQNEGSANAWVCPI